MCLAIPGQIVGRVPDTESLVVVEVAGVRRTIDVALLETDPPSVGDWVLIHVGFAMCKVGEAEAAEQMRTLALLGQRDSAVEEVIAYGLEGCGEEDAPRSGVDLRGHLIGQTASKGDPPRPIARRAALPS